MIFSILQFLNMKTVLAILFTLAAVALAAPNFHQRQLYYNDQENICALSSSRDELEFLITVEGGASKQLVANTHTICRTWVTKNVDRITPLPKWSYIEGETELIFDQEVTYYRLGFVIRAIFAKNTLHSPTTIDGKNYDCVIVGTGEKHHYGGDGTNYPPPQVRINCSSAIAQLQ